MRGRPREKLAWSALRCERFELGSLGPKDLDIFPLLNVNPTDANGSVDRERILAGYFKVASIRGDNRALVRKFLLGAVWSAIVTPLLFYLWFGDVGWFAIGFTVFLTTLCLLFALGFFIQTKTEYHTPVPMEGSIADRIGAFWLIACAFGPFFGWIITSFPPTEGSWRWQYLLRAFLSVVVPVITAVPLVPYVRGKATLIALPLLLVITALPITSCLWVLADMHDGPQVAQLKVLELEPDGSRKCQILNGLKTDLPCEEIRPVVSGEEYSVVWLRHTRRVLAKQRLTH